MAEEDQGVGGINPTMGAWLVRPWNVSLSRESLAWAAVAVGIFLRVLEYSDLRPLYLDERLLLQSIVGRQVFDFHHVLEDDQMAPPGFLVIERLLVRLPLDVRASGRLFPLLCGAASVVLTYFVARRYLDRRAVPAAVAMLALGDHLLYYSAEVKQYSCDLLCALLAFLLAAPPPPGTMTRGRFLALAVFGLVAPWFSFPVVFVLAAVGLQLILSAAGRKEYRRAVITAAACAGWVVSFASCYRLSRSILSQRDFIWVWWDFAFLRLPRSLTDLSSLGETLANVFIHPASLLSPFTLPYTAGLACLLWLFGALSLGRRWPGGLLILAGPLALALAASFLRLYPFHGRLLFYLVPTLLLLVAEGAAAIGRRWGWPLTVVLVGLFLYGQAAEITWHRLIQARARTFDSHGDVKNDLLDYLEFKRARQQRNALQQGTGP